MAEKDLGGEHMLECYIFARRTWFQTVPLLLQDYPSHPMIMMDFIQPFLLNGTWDRWAQLICSHQAEVKELRQILSCPVYHFSSTSAPELVLAQLMEPVYVSFQAQLSFCSLLQNTAACIFANPCDIQRLGHAFLASKLHIDWMEICGRDKLDCSIIDRGGIPHTCIAAMS